MQLMQQVYNEQCNDNELCNGDGNSIYIFTIVISMPQWNAMNLTRL